MNSIVENKKVVEVECLELERLIGTSKKTGQPYDIVATTIVLKNGARIQAKLDQNVATLLFNN